MIPTGRLWVLLCLLAVPMMAAGFFPGLGGAVLALDTLALALAALDFLMARRVRLEVSRQLPPRLSVGAPNKVELLLVHRGPRDVEVRVRDDVPESFTAEPEEAPLRLPADSQTRWVYRVTPAKRGRFGFGDVNVRVRGPLGLLLHERRVPAAQDVAVFPDMRGASRLLLSGAALDLVNLGLRQLRRDGRGSEFARLRDYSQGDSVREVDWKATARRTRPVTRVMESERSQSLLICVDAGRSMAAQVDGLTKLDHAVNAALFLAFVAVRNGDRVGLAVFADGVKAYLPPAAGRLQYRKILDTLYATTPSLTYVDYLALFKELNVRLNRRSLLCVFTDFLDEEQASTLVAPLHRLARRHVPLCLSVRDTALTTLLHTPPAGPEQAYQQAVASELLSDRESLKAKVSAGGVHMLDVRPDELSLAAVNRYLDIKARGVL
ncbi:Cell division protein DivIC (FtsB), stabilizes FtsL against RasP cleavage [Cystobacter fuscus DSM 2262]|uniref:Cell division protein DivIC (FtsB), stabilizes FtsL against RasP cleavage n=1 Tax=Cystobacter fuscus (strain ATCC 25194 / DSM 2262 / NBRC 100088 / M29) TaxID=1242864 RepID=S9P7E3_CYSF2|nr:DUF58 domain-containing protein [Cystobacter fuscus]EPX58112.1 Cell division protein DivIC (FtsB), stabilizes FtsL against RasP cleavage [Cystobacter fuscus DSM 2262]